MEKAWKNCYILLLHERDIYIQVNIFSPDVIQYLLDSWKIQTRTNPKKQGKPAQIIPNNLGKKSEITAALQPFNTEFSEWVHWLRIINSLKIFSPIKFLLSLFKQPFDLIHSQAPNLTTQLNCHYPLSHPSVVYKHINSEVGAACH
jgi:hypothetical protein